MPQVQLKEEVTEDQSIMREKTLYFNAHTLASEARGEFSDDDYVEFALEVIEKIRQSSASSQLPEDTIEDPWKIPQEIFDETRGHFGTISFAGYNIYPVPPEARSYRLRYTEDDGIYKKHWRVRGYELNNVFYVWQVCSAGIVRKPDEE